MTELELQSEYVMDFFCRRADGLGFREIKNNAVSPDLFIPANLYEFLRRIRARHGTTCSKRANTMATSKNCFGPLWI